MCDLAPRGTVRLHGTGGGIHGLEDGEDVSTGESPMVAHSYSDERREIICLACHKPTLMLILGWDGRIRCLDCHERFSRVTKTVRAHKPGEHVIHDR